MGENPALAFAECGGLGTAIGAESRPTSDLYRLCRGEGTRLGPATGAESRLTSDLYLLWRGEGTGLGLGDVAVTDAEHFRSGDRAGEPTEDLLLGELSLVSFLSGDLALLGL